MNRRNLNRYQIVPELASIDSDVRKLNNAYLLGNLAFFESPKNKSKVHYSLQQEKSIKAPDEYSFRNDYYYFSDGIWTFSRTLLRINFSFKYNTSTNEISYSRALRLLPFQIGGIQTLGTYVSDIVSLDLHKRGFLLFRGCAYIKNGATTAIVAPGFSGKTTHLTSELENGASYIAEDAVLIDPSKKLIYPTQNAKMSRIFGRKANSKLAETVVPGKLSASPIGTLNLCSRARATGRDIEDHLLLNGLYLLNGLFIKTLLFQENKLSETILKNIIPSLKLLEWKEYYIEDYDFGVISE